MKNNKKFTHVLTTGILTTVLLFSFGTVTLANEEDTIVVVAEISDDENPSLIPGDFFYFVKKMTEKIRLALTFDDYEQAQLLTEIAAERIGEANALITEGKKEEAESLLKEAIATQELAEEKLTNGEDEGNEDQDSISSKENDEDVAGEADAEKDGTEGREESGEFVESKIANNIDALLVVLQKIDNPRAQEAIMKNIEKSFGKLEKKIKKLDESDSKFEDKMNNIEEKLADGKISAEEAKREKTKLVEELDNKIEKIEEKEMKDVEKVNKHIEKEAAKERKKNAREEAKELKELQNKEAKELKKMQHEATKIAAEKQREVTKKMEQERKNAKNEHEQNNEKAEKK